MTRYVFPILNGLGGIAILLWLGFWQLDRLEWKEGVLDQIARKLAAEPQPWSQLFADYVPFKAGAHQPRADLQYAPTVAEGTLRGDELHVLTSIKFTGPGFRVIKPMVIDDQPVPLDLGFVLEAQKDVPRYEGRVRVTGNILYPRELTKSTPDPDRGRNIWFARDLARIQAQFETSYPLLVARKIELWQDGAWVLSDQTKPLPVTVNISNNHRQYAITWFSLAAVWLGMTGFWLWRIRAKD